LLASRQFRRLLVWSACAHVALFLLMNVRLLSNRTVIPPASVMVELVAPPASGAPSKGRAAAPAPAKPKPERVVNLPKPKAIEPPKPKEAAKPVVKPIPRPEPPKPAAPAEPTKSAAEVLASLRERMAARPGAEAPESATAAASASAAGGGRFDPEMAAYHNRIKALLRSNWANGAFANDPSLRAEYVVRVDGGGGILSIRMVRSSGNPFFDESAERAIEKSAPWPAPPRGELELDVVFNPGGVA
jgi:TonB family protein